MTIRIWRVEVYLTTKTLFHRQNYHQHHKMDSRLNTNQLNEALNQLADWFPEEATNLKNNRDAIIKCILEGTEPTPGSKLLSLKSSAAHEPPAALPPLTPCEEAIGVVIVDAVMFLLGLVGLHVSNQQRIARALLKNLSPDTLRGFLRDIRNFNEATGALNKAKALFKLLGGIYKAGCLRAVFKVLKEEMTWWEWVKTGMIAVAQIMVWFATDGVAFVAEAALSIMSAESLIEDAIKADKVCGK